MPTIDITFDFCARHNGVPQNKQIDAFTFWVQSFYPSARFRYPKRPSQRRPFSPSHHGNSWPNRHPYTVVATVTVDTSRYAPDIEALMQVVTGAGIPMVSTLTNNERRRNEGWDEKRIASMDIMFQDGDVYAKEFFKWSTLRPGGLRFREVFPDHDPLILLFSQVASGFVPWRDWIPDHPYFTDPSYERVPF